MTEEYYLLGALRDGCLSTEWTIVYVQQCKEWLTDVIIPKFKMAFGIDLSQHKLYWMDGAWRLKFKSKKIWKELTLLKSSLPIDRETQKLYIQSFWDAEGGCPRFPDKSKALYLSFTQKDKQSLEELKQMLIETFGIKTGSVRLSDRKKDVWRVCIESRKEMLKFIELIGSAHPEKKLRLEKIVDILKSN
ncbi:MAG: hypothetical protein HYW24_00600 [Candidatus Aenigmarchaeota archaeon]|nr:hypothetical protein [Candidatus Aenigmarchaeota archaeon]